MPENNFLLDSPQESRTTPIVPDCIVWQPHQATGSPDALAGLYAKMAQVMGSLQRIEKRGHHSQFNFDYVLQEDVYDAVRAAMSDVKLALFTTMVELDIAETLGKSSTGKDQTTTRARVKFMMTIADGQTGATVSLPWWAEATDTQDKALTKAAAQARKYFLLATFIISTGDDDPDGAGSHQSQSQGRKTQGTSKPRQATSQATSQAKTQAPTTQGNGQGKPLAPNPLAVTTPANIESATPDDSKDFTGYFTRSAPYFGINKDDASKVLKENNNDALAAFEVLKADWLERQTA